MLGAPLPAGPGEAGAPAGPAGAAGGRRSYPATRLAAVHGRRGARLSQSFAGPWWRRSLSLIALLLGFLSGSVATVHLVNAVSMRTFAGLLVLALCEALVFFRRRVRQEPLPLSWQLLDNGRIGLVYGIVLEAFKVGS